MILSKYVLTYVKNQKVLLFNTINESIVIIEKCFFIEKEKSISSNFKNIDYLKDNDFFIDDKTALNFLLTKKREKTSTLHITISLTQDCNFACPYCSQNNAKKQGIIKNEVIDDCVEYIENILCQTCIRAISITFIGGEPLLAIPQILYFMNKIEKVTHNIHYQIITNGSLLSDDFVKKIRNTTFKVTLSEKNDHDQNRYYKNGNKSFDTIISAIKECSSFFLDKKTNNNLTLRYNCSSVNIDAFNLFISFIKKEFPFINYVDLAPVYSFDYNKSIGCDLNKFKDFYIQAIETLIKNQFFIEFPTTNYTNCYAYSEYDLKVYYDGTIGLCDGYDFNKRKGKIKDLSKNLNKKQIFECDSPYTKECLSCNKIFLCAGKIICNPTPCDFSIYDLESFLWFYTEQAEKGNAKFFLTSDNE